MINQQDGLSVRWGAPCAPCFFGAMAWESDNHPWLMLAGKIGENYSVGGFSLVRTAHPTADGAVLPGLLPFCARISQPHGVHGSGLAGTCAQPRGGASKYEISAGCIERAVGCAVRTMFFRCHGVGIRQPSLAHACRENRGKVQRWRIFLWCARRTLPQVEPCCWGLLPFCTRISQPHGAHGSGLAGTCAQPRGGA